MATSYTPVEIVKEGEGVIRITWDDGHQGRYGTRYLRAACQCAVCVDEWTGERKVTIESIPEDIRALKIAPVGQYGIHIDWSDGHGTGIYAFDVLRKLCPCSDCMVRPISAL